MKVIDPTTPEPDDAERLIATAARSDAAVDRSTGAVRTALANAMVGMKKEFYGRGPEAAKAWVLDDYVFVVLEGGLTRSEQTMLADGKGDEVRDFRLSFQETVGPTVMNAVAQILGRAVLTYHSQIVFDPVRTFEIFVLEPASAV